MCTIRNNAILAILLVPTALFGCGAPTVEHTSESKQEERWSSADNPAIFTNGLDRRLEQLPTEGEVEKTPWAGSYWPTYNDSINYRWDGPSSMSAAAKYGAAFGNAFVENMVSRYHGIDSRTGATVCTTDDQCNGSLGEACAIREGFTSGRCIPTWFGICHAWAPAAIQLPEPQHEVFWNGVTFKVNDLKALASLVYNSTTSRFVSLRCNRNDGSDEIEYDEFGRPINRQRECRDTNPGTYHLLLANYLGKQKLSFVEDRTQDYQVWNQPLRNYKVLDTRPITASEANELVGVRMTGGETVEKTGTVTSGQLSQLGGFPVVAGKRWRVSLSGTNDADLYVRFGSEPTNDLYDCGSAGGSSNETCEGVVPEGATELFVAVLGYSSEPADFKARITVGGEVPSQYAFNPDAVSFVYFRTVVGYIAESSPHTDGPLAHVIDNYTHHDEYEYLLELDAAGEVIGGEWIGSSKRNHPDFLWLPIGPGTSTVAGGAISHANVKMLVDMSVR
jgi:hypothetical protein